MVNHCQVSYITNKNLKTLKLQFISCSNSLMHLADVEMKNQSSFAIYFIMSNSFSWILLLRGLTLPFSASIQATLQQKHNWETNSTNNRKMLTTPISNYVSFDPKEKFWRQWWIGCERTSWNLIQTKLEVLLVRMRADHGGEIKPMVDKAA